MACFSMRLDNAWIGTAFLEQTTAAQAKLYAQFQHLELVCRRMQFCIGINIQQTERCEHPCRIC